MRYLVLLAGVLYFYKLGAFSLYDAAETTYGEFVKQILSTGDWLTMHYNGETIFDKPPLYSWLAAAFSRLIGFSELAMRLPSALSGIAAVAVTYFLGKTFYNQRTGILSALIVMTAFQFMVQSRMAELDVLLTLLIALSLLFFYLGYQTSQKKYYFFFYLPMGAALLVKGLIGAALPVFAVFLFLLFKKELNKIPDILNLPGILIALAIGTPWYIAEYLLHGKTFLDFALGFLFLSRFQGAVSGHAGPWYYYFLSILIGFAPYSHFLPLALKQTFARWKNDPELLTLSLIIPAFVVFSIARTKIPNYVLPLFPFLAVMVGKLWDEILSEPEAKRLGSSLQKPRRLVVGFTVSNFFLAIVVVLIIIGVIIAGQNYSGPYQELMPDLLLLAAVLIGGSLLSIGFYFFRAYLLSFAVLPLITFLITGILTNRSLPLVEKYKGTKELAQGVAKVIKPHEQIAAYDIGNRPGVVFYNVKPIIFLSKEAEVKDFLKNKKGYCFVLQKGSLTVLH